MNESNREYELIGKVRYKSPYSHYIVAGIGMMMLFLSANNILKIVGAGLILLSLVNRFVVPDHTVMNVYGDHIEVYPQKENIFLANDEIAEWNINSHDQYAVYLRKTDGSSAFLKTFDTDKAKQYLKQTMSDKATLNITMKDKTKKEDGFFYVLINKIKKR